jgi:hypothetical protein
MEERYARRVATDWNSAYEKRHDSHGQEGQATWAAVYDALRSSVADDADQHAIDEVAEMPVAYVLSPAAVFKVTPLPIIDGPPKAARANVAWAPIVRESASIELETSIGGFGGFSRFETRWTFRLGQNLVVEVTTGIQSSIDNPDPEHMFALALSERLGWQLPHLG